MSPWASDNERNTPGALGTGARRHQAAVLLLDAAPHEFLEAARRPDVMGQSGAHHGHEKPFMAHHLEQGGADVQDERYQRRDRVAGKAEHRPWAHPPERHRMPGPLRDLPEQHAHAGVAESVLHVIVVAHRHAAGGDQRIALQRPFEDTGQPLAAITHDSKGLGHGADLADRRREGVAVAVDDLSPRRLVVHPDELVAGGDDGHHRPPPHGYGGLADGRHESDVRGPQQLAALEDLLALADVFPRRTDVTPLAIGAGHGDAVAAHLGVLDADNGVGSRRNRSSGHDPDGGSRKNALARHPAGGDLPSHGEGCRRVWRGAGQVAPAHREPVHGGVRKRRHVTPRTDVLAQHAAQAVGDRDLLGGKRRDVLEDELHGLIHGGHADHHHPNARNNQGTREGEKKKGPISKDRAFEKSRRLPTLP